MKLILLVLLTLSLSSNEILTQYRKSGLKNIEKYLDAELTKKAYWDNELKDIDTSFGYLESYDSVLSCDKNSSTLTLFQKDTNNTFIEKTSFSAFTGKISGDKKVEGDLKTPVGIYNIKQRLDKENKLDSFYGPLAFVTSYPNQYDKARGKNGSGIWVHGLPINQKRDDFTRGCIAIDNKSIKCLDNGIDINNSIIIINPDITQEDIPKSKFSALLGALYAWRAAWKYSDYDKYMSFYALDFKKTDGMVLDMFKMHKEFVFEKKEKKSIHFYNINIIKYPNTQNIYQITFSEYYKTKYFKFEGDKILMVKLDEQNNMKIFLEN